MFSQRFLNGRDVQRGSFWSDDLDGISFLPLLQGMEEGMFRKDLNTQLIKEIITGIIGLITLLASLFT